MSRVYLLLFCSFLITVEVVAAGKSKVDVNICASAATTNNLEKVLFTSQPESTFLYQIVMSSQANSISEQLRVELIHFEASMSSLESKIKKGEEIPYKKHGMVLLHDEYNLATFLFKKLLHLYSSALFYHNRMNSDATLYVVNTYKQRMIFLLSDKDKGVDIDYQDRNGVNFLMMAAANGYVNIVELLIQRGVNLSHRAVNGRFQRRTALGITRLALDWYENDPPDATDRMNPRNVMDEEVYWHESYPPNEMERDLEHIRMKKIENYNYIIKLLREAATA